MDKRYILAGIVLVILVIVIGSQIVKSPEINLVDISFSDLSLSTITADLTFEVINPNLLGGTLNDLNLAVYGGTDQNRFLIADVTKDSVPIPAMGTTLISIPATVRTIGAGRSGLSLLLDGQLPIQVTGSVSASSFGISFPVPINKTYTLVREGTDFKLE